MIHTPDIIATCTEAWRTLIGKTVTGVESFAHRNLDELAELVFTVDAESKVFVAPKQEDGQNDDVLFYWLSIDTRTHYVNDSLVEIPQLSRKLSPMIGRELGSFELYGDRDKDAVYACRVAVPKFSCGLGASRWNAGKQRFGRFGTDDLAILDHAQLNECVTNQGLSSVANIH